MGCPPSLLTPFPWIWPPSAGSLGLIVPLALLGRHRQERAELLAGRAADGTRLAAGERRRKELRRVRCEVGGRALFRLVLVAHGEFQHAGPRGGKGQITTLSQGSRREMALSGNSTPGSTRKGVRGEACAG